MVMKMGSFWREEDDVEDVMEAATDLFEEDDSAEEDFSGEPLSRGVLVLWVNNGSTVFM